MKNFDSTEYEKKINNLREKEDFAYYLAYALKDAGNINGFFIAYDDGRKIYAEIMEVYKEWEHAIHRYYGIQK